LGPISEAELLAQQNRQLQSSMTSMLVYDPDQDTGCPTGGMPYLTNFSAVLTSNGTTIINFYLVGGTNGYFYDIYSLNDLSLILNE